MTKSNTASTAKMEFIAEQALRLFVRQGYDGTSTREIAKACGMSPGLLHYYTGPKQNILGIAAA